MPRKVKRLSELGFYIYRRENDSLDVRVYYKKSTEFTPSIALINECEHYAGINNPPEE